MKKAVSYLVSVFFTLLLIFTTIAAIAAGTVNYYALNTDAVLDLVRAQDLDARVHSTLESSFKQQENTTGVPADIYADSISEAAVEPIIRETVKNGFAYLRGETATLGVSPDYSALEAKLRTFFTEYAEKENIPQDETFEKALRDTADSAEEQITEACDVFRFGALNETGVFQQAKKYIPWAGFAAVGLIAASAVLAVILLLLHLHRVTEGCYWIATALLIASAAVLIPSVWLEKTRWFDRFAVKTDQTFAAVTGYLYGNTHMLTVIAVGGICAAALLYLIFVIGSAVRRKREAS